MAKINVLKPFLLNMGAGVKRFEAGIIDVADEIASHWYVRAHSEPIAAAPEPVAPPVPELDQAPAAEPPPPVAANAEPDPAAPATTDTPVSEADDKDALKTQAEALGIDVDGRWGIDRLKAEIAAKAAPAASDDADKTNDPQASE